MLVNLDLALQPDASYKATRVEIPDASATNMDMGQLTQVDPPSYSRNMTTDSVQQQGQTLSQQPVGSGYPYQFGNTTSFLISPQFPVPSDLPFNPTFNSATLAAGQMVSVGSTSISFQGNVFTDPTSVTLMPQTIDASVGSVSSEGSYSVYTVQLAGYDLIVQMNSPQTINSTALPRYCAETVYVYVGSNTSLLTSQPLITGGTYRFNGLLFNDAGTLRLVCNQVGDGVPQ